MLKAAVAALSAFVALSAALPALPAEQADEWRDFATQLHHNMAASNIASEALVQSYREAAGKLRAQLDAVTKERDELKAKLAERPN